MQRLEPSWLHRNRGWQLGHAPRWWYASDCHGGGVVFLVGAALFSVGLFVAAAGVKNWRNDGASAVILAPGLIAAAIGWFRWVYAPFSNRERFARARIRRSECVGCGVRLAASDVEYCHECNP